MVGRIRPDLFPRVFGPGADQPLDAAIVRRRSPSWPTRWRRHRGAAHARGHGAWLPRHRQRQHGQRDQADLRRSAATTSRATRCAASAAPAAQHACQVADALGIGRILIHPLASVLSAYGIGLADIRVLRQRAIEAPLDATPGAGPAPGARRAERRGAARAVPQQGVPERIETGERGAPALRWHRRGAAGARRLAAQRDARRLRARAPHALRLHRRRRGPSWSSSDGRGASAAWRRSTSRSARWCRAAPATRSSRSPRRRCSPAGRASAGRAVRGARLCPRETCAPATRWPARRWSRVRPTTVVVEPGWRLAVTDARPSRPRARRAAAPRGGARHRRPIRSCSRSSTVSSCRSPSRWARRCRTRPIRSTSRSGWISPAPCSTPTAAGRQRAAHAGAPRLDGRVGAGDLRADAARAGARATSSRSTTPMTAARTCPTSPWSCRCSTHDAAEPLFFVAARGHHADIGGITPGSMPPVSHARSTRRACCSTTSARRAAAVSARRRCAALLHRRPLARRATRSQNIADLQGADRRLRRRARTSCASMVARVTACDGRAGLHGPRAGQRRGVRAPGDRPAARRRVRATDGRRREIRVRDRRRRARRAGRRVDFTGTSAAAAPTTSTRPRPVDPGRRALRVPHAWSTTTSR